MKKSIVIVINRLDMGGAEHQAIDDINELYRRQISVSLITLRSETSKSFKNDLEIPDDDWHLVEFKNLYDFQSYRKLVRLLKRLKPSTIISHLWFSNTILRIIDIFVKIPVLLTFEQNVYDTVKTKKQFFVDFFLQFLSTKIIAVSEAVKESLARHYIFKQRIVVILNSVDVYKFNIAKPINIKNDLDIDTKDFVFIFIGRLIHQKGVDVLIRSFVGVKKAHLLIVGHGPNLNSLIKDTKDLGISSRIHFLGERNDVPSLMKSSDAFILPSRFEGVGIVVLEAMASGLPIIVSDFSAAKELVDKNSAIIVKKEDSEDLNRAINLMINNKDLRLKLIKNTKERIKRFDSKKHVDKILELISDI